MPRDRWHDLCDSVAEDDGLPTWDEASPATERKLYVWYRYIEITARAMRNKPAFPAGLAYVDLFAGSGICTLKGSRKRIPGSVLIAAHAPKPFSRIIACEKSATHAQACEARLERTPAGRRCRVLHGDCNELAEDVLREIPRGTLTLAFVDPTGLDARFETIAAISRNARVDWVVLFADAYDISRNAEQHYRQDPNSKLDQVLGPDSGWREQLDQLENPTGFNKRRLFAEIYKGQLEKCLAYTHVEDHTVYLDERPLYKLIYASKHALGLKFWRQALKKEASGQRGLFD